MTIAGRRPHVVMIVGNDVRTDTRVRKSAVSLVRCGLRVTLLCYSSVGQREESILAGVRLLRVPVPWCFRDAAGRSPLVTRWALGYRSDQAAGLARRRLVARRRDLLAWRGRIGGHQRDGAPGAARRVASGVAYTTGVTVLDWASKLVRLTRRFQKRLDHGRSMRQSGLDRAPWRTAVPAAMDYEDAMIDEIVALRPDAIHAHDVELVGVADKAAAVASLAGTHVPWIYDAHEFVAGLSLYRHRTALQRAGWLDLEASFVRRAHRVVTVSPALGEELSRRYGLERPAAVVLNAPWYEPRRPVGGIRAAIGLADETPLLVYSGGVTPPRGVQTGVEALRHLPDVHLAVIAVPPGGWNTPQIAALADKLGVSDRVHVTAPVRPAEVANHLASADIGLIPILRVPSHDLALTNKLFEYLHAGLPVVVSDCREQARFVIETGVGEVHEADDPVDLARAVRKILDGPAPYRSAVHDSGIAERYSWQRAEAELAAVYADLFGDVVNTPDPTSAFPRLREEAANELAGPTTMAIVSADDQASRIAEAVRRCHGIESVTLTTAVAPSRPGGPTTVFNENVKAATHVLLSAVAEAPGVGTHPSIVDVAEMLRNEGHMVGLLLTEEPDGELPALLAKITAFDGPVFVTSLRAVGDLPGSVWLPVVAARPERLPRELFAEERPTVVSLSRTAIVTSAWRVVDRVLRNLQAEGLVTYVSLIGAPADEVVNAIIAADVVVDDLSCDMYSDDAVVAMAAGRVVVSYVSGRHRTALGTAPPTYEAVPDNLEDVLRSILADHGGAEGLAAQAQAYATRVHGGTRTAEVLAPFLGLPLEIRPGQVEAS